MSTLAHLFFLKCHGEGALFKKLSQRHNTLPVTEFTLCRASLKCATVRLNKGNNVSLLLVSGSNEINQSLGEESACASLFCHRRRVRRWRRGWAWCKSKRLSVHQRRQGSDTIGHGHQWPSIPEQWVIIGALRGPNRLTDGWTWEDVFVWTEWRRNAALLGQRRTSESRTSFFLRVTIKPPSVLLAGFKSNAPVSRPEWPWCTLLSKM